MALQSFTVSIGALRDVNNNDKNYVSGEAIYVKTIGGSFASIFRDLAGASEIAQDGLANQTDDNGQFTFFVEAGDYILEYQNQSTPVTVVGSDYFNSRIEESVNQIIIETSSSRGFRVVGDFAGGFTYELSNDVAIDGSGNYWVYADVNELPVVITAGTTPSSPTYTQVTFNQASGVTTTAGVNAQQFIDNFELKIFQSPTDNLTKIEAFAGGVGVVYEVRKTHDSSLATIYSDAAGATEIVQNGTSNVSNGDAEVVFYIDDGDYTVTVNEISSRFNVGNEIKSILDFGGVDDDDGSTGTTNNRDAFARYFAYLNIIGGGRLYLPKTKTGGYLIVGDDTTPVNSEIEVVADEGVYIRIVYSGGAVNSPFNNNTLKYNRELLKIQHNYGFNVYGSPQVGKLPSETLPSLQSGSGVYTKPRLLSGFDFVAVDLANPDATVTPIAQSAEALILDSENKTVCAMKYADIGEETVALCRNGAGGLHFAGVKTLNGYSYYSQNLATQDVALREETTGLATVVLGVPYTLMNQQRDLFNNSMLSVRIITNRMYSVMCNGLVIGTYETRSDITGVIFGTEGAPVGDNTAVSQFSSVSGSVGGGSKPLRVIACGDSISDNDVQYSPYRYMSSIMQTSGQQLAELRNIAVSGDTSGQQLARLQTVGSGYDYCLIQVGVNDIQGAVAPSTFTQNIVAMCNYAKSIGAKPIVGIPTQWYSLAEANANGQSGGQNTANNALGYTYRALLIRAVASAGALVNMQSIKNMGAITASWLDADIEGVQSDALLTDNIHPTPFGAMMIGLSWAESLWGAINGNGAKCSDELESVPVSWMRNGFGSVDRPSFSKGKMNGSVDLCGGASAEGNPFMQLPAHLRPTSTILETVVTTDTNDLPAGLASLYIGTDGNCYGFNLPASAVSINFNGVDVFSKSLK